MTDSPATPRELAVFIAGILGVPAKTALAVDRQLRDAGLRESFGRGNSARPATVRDAALLLIAFTATATFAPSVAMAPEMVERYSELPADISGFAPRRLQDSEILPFVALGDDHNFFDALIALIRAAIHDRLPERPQVKVVMIAPWPSAEILVRGRINGENCAFANGYRHQIPDADWPSTKRHLLNLADKYGVPDFKERRSFGLPTISAIADFLRKEGG